jgi:hypothetical protein
LELELVLLELLALRRCFESSGPACNSRSCCCKPALAGIVAASDSLSNAPSPLPLSPKGRAVWVALTTWERRRFLALAASWAGVKGGLMLWSFASCRSERHTFFDDD